MVARLPLAVAASAGGHLDLLLAVEGAWADREHAIVTPPSPRADALEAAGRRVVRVPDPGRLSPPGAARAASVSLAAAFRLRPRMVLTSGAAAAVPFVLACRGLGARVVFVETMARVHDGSAAGRALHRVASDFVVQWPELLAVYPRARLCRPVLLEGGGERPAGGEGTLVAVGTHAVPFERLLRIADEGVAAGVLPRPALAQTGPAAGTLANMETVATLPPHELAREVARREVVVCHGGAGIMALAVRHGRRPLVLPRRRDLGEHVDDHQTATVAKLAEHGLVVQLDSELALDAAVGLARAGVEPTHFEGESLAAVIAELLGADAGRGERSGA